MKPYKGYVPEIWFENDDNTFHGNVANIDDVIHFTARKMDDLEREFHESVDDYLEACEEINREPQKPYSGKVALRMPTEVHAIADEAAKRDGKSLNQWITDTINEAARKRNADGSIKIKMR